MKKKVLLIVLLGGMLMPSLLAADIISTSFENDSPGDEYFDTGDASMDHDLVNNAGQADVDSTNTVGDLGFDASYVNTRDSDGLGDGDDVGVTDSAGSAGSFTDGSQGYQISDSDGQFNLTFDTVDLSAISTPVTVSIDYFLAETNYETNDLLRVGLDLDGTIVDLLNTTGLDIDDLGIEGNFNTLSTTITGVSEATLFVQFDSNAQTEELFLDNVVFATAVPEPSSIALLGLLGLAGAIRRRK